MSGVEIYRATAPAKVNLFLHITGRRDDGYHLLESLFVFTSKGDELIFTENEELAFALSGPFADALSVDDGNDNLVLKAARLLATRAGIAPNVSIELAKNLPVAAGIGGGSSDAAATLLALNEIWKLGMDIETLAGLALPLGADVPACLYLKPIFARGIGEIITPYDYNGPKHILLVNPGIGVATPAIFKTFHASGEGFDEALTMLDDTDHLLASTQNVLQEPAKGIEPAIGQVLAVLNGLEQAALPRMSGSGATCFALFESAEACTRAASEIRSSYPDWWISADTIRS